MRSEIQAVAWRSYWPVALLAVTFLVVVGLFGTYLTSRQQVANDRAEKQRRAICAILANIPGHIPPEIVKARVVFARANHPNDCQPVVRLPAKRTVTPTPAPSPTATATVVLVRPRPTKTITAQARQPTPSPRHSPSPSPSPSRTCITVICLGPRWSDGPALRQVRSLLRR